MAGLHPDSGARGRILIRSASARSLRLALIYVEDRTRAEGSAKAAGSQLGAAASEAGSLPSGDSVRLYRARRARGELSPSIAGYAQTVRHQDGGERARTARTCATPLPRLRSYGQARGAAPEVRLAPSPAPEDQVHSCSQARHAQPPLACDHPSRRRQRDSSAPLES